MYVVTKSNLQPASKCNLHVDSHCSMKCAYWMRMGSLRARGTYLLLFLSGLPHRQWEAQLGRAPLHPNVLHFVMVLLRLWSPGSK